eukprot:656431_1
MGGCLFVLITYMYNASLREHPAVLIFSRCIFDFLFGLSFFIHYFLDARDLACHPEHCTTLGTIILFCFLCSQGYFAASIHDLYLSLRNPFSQPHTLVGRTHIYIMMISATLTLFVDLNYSFSYRLDLQYCAISSSQTDVNPYNLMLVYVPICLLIILSISVNIYAIKRLRDGLADTFYIRMQAIKDSLFYCLGYTVYFMVLGLSYLMVWRDDQIHNDSQLKDENVWHYLFALTVAFLGVNTLLVWLYSNQNGSNLLHKRNVPIRRRSARRGLSAKHVLSSNTTDIYCTRKVPMRTVRAMLMTAKKRSKRNQIISSSRLI